MLALKLIRQVAVLSDMTVQADFMKGLIFRGLVSLEYLPGSRQSYVAPMKTLAHWWYFPLQQLSYLVRRRPRATALGQATLEKGPHSMFGGVMLI